MMEREDILFAILKDKAVLSGKELKNKYPNVNTNELRLRIVNYQVDKYGFTLYKSKKHLIQVLKNSTI